MAHHAELPPAFGRSHLAALDGVRAVAVFLVIFYHLGVPRVPGAHGVMIFFVLSGFLITWLLLREHEQTGTISLAGFYRRRTLRIFPAFYVYWLLLVGLLTITGRPVLWPHAWSAFAYTSNYYSALHGDPNDGFSHTWSLAIEEQFYLLWPLIFLAWRGSLAGMATRLAVVIGAVWVYRGLLCYGFGVPQHYVYAAFDTRLDSLAVGCLTAVLLKQGSLSRFCRVATASQFLPLVTLALLIASIFLGNAWVPRYREAIGFAVEPPLIAVLLVQLVILSGTSLWAWTEYAPVKFLGRISYSLYLYQQLTLSPAKRLVAAYPVIVQIAVAIAVTIVIATGSYYFVERPFLKLKGLGRRARSEAPVEQVSAP